MVSLPLIYQAKMHYGCIDYHINYLGDVSPLYCRYCPLVSYVDCCIR